MERNSKRTRRKILLAVGRLLARSGFQKLGVNAVAREARVDKVLVYRYFGGMPELLRAYAEEGGFWPSAEELLTQARGGQTPQNAALAANLLIQFGRALRRQPVTQEILRWELLDRNALTDALAHYREEEGMKLIRTFGELPAVDIQAIASVLAAGQTYLILRAKTADVYNGLKLKTDRDWRRIEKCIESLVQLALMATQTAEPT